MGQPTRQSGSLATAIAPLALAPSGLIIAWTAGVIAWPAWAFMWVLAWSIFLGCKWLTWWPARRVAAPMALHAAYLFAWPGMNAHAFLASAGSQRGQPAHGSDAAKPPRQGSPPPWLSEWLMPVLRIVLGATAFWSLARVWPADAPLLRGWTGMLALALVLHFGLFDLLSAAWRSRGYVAPPLMDGTLFATSLGAFWGRHWNTAFRDLTRRYVFRPLAGRIGARSAVLMGFLVSGAVHDVVISVPARAGYGLPTLYFLIQFVGVTIERSRLGNAMKLGGAHAFRGWCWTASWLLIPAGLLFHRPFVEEVMLPFLRALKAL